LYAANATGYLNLCRLLSRHAEGNDEASVAAKQRQPLKRRLLANCAEGLLAVSSDATLAEFFPRRFYQMACKRLVSLSSGEMVGTARCAVPARVVAGGTNDRAALAFEGVAPLHAARTSQRDVPTTLNTY